MVWVEGVNYFRTERVIVSVGDFSIFFFLSLYFVMDGGGFGILVFK